MPKPQVDLTLIREKYHEAATNMGQVSHPAHGKRGKKKKRAS